MSNSRDACNQLVYTWRRSYNKSIEKNDVAPRPLSIPTIAKKAGIAPKTIYTNPTYKSIALTAIAKTQVKTDIEDFVLSQAKEQYSKHELKSIIIGITKKNETKLKSLEGLLAKKINEVEKIKKENSSLTEINEAYLVRIVALESENSILKGQINILNERTDVKE